MENVERIMIFQIVTPLENMFMCLREDDKMEIGVARTNSVDAGGNK